jgi:hypothetical protein
VNWKNLLTKTETFVWPNYHHISTSCRLWKSGKGRKVHFNQNLFVENTLENRTREKRPVGVHWSATSAARIRHSLTWLIGWFEMIHQSMKLNSGGS